MLDVPIKVLGISATGIKDGNCDKVMREALKEAAGMGSVETEFISLAGKEIRTCDHCQWCVTNMKPCKYEDDATWIAEKMAEADGFIWGTPVWDFTIPPFLPSLISRFRYQVFLSGEFRNKVLGTYVVSWFGMGQEMALMSLEALGIAHLLIPVARGSAIVSTAARGQRPSYMEHGALDDNIGMVRIRTMARRTVEITRKIKHADQAGVGVPDADIRSITCGKYPLWKKKAAC
jgi:multimeric flavodoxin WrbA